MTRGIKNGPKQCQHCGASFSPKLGEGGRRWEARRYCSHECYQLANRGTNWKVRKLRKCPICGDEFRREREDHNVVTCGKQICRVRYRTEVVAPKRAATMRASYASGSRQPSGQYERMLWPLLSDKGWVRGLQWTDAVATFQLDFALLQTQLNVELDGPEHRQRRNRERDAERDAELARRGWRVLRIQNESVDASPEAVVRQIEEWAAAE